MINDFIPSPSTILGSRLSLQAIKWIRPLGEEFSVCRQARRTCIDEVNGIFDFLAITAKQVSGVGK
ncbi:MAG: hypothetical protein J6X12_01335 [Paludibacteraceae bacterium]|nr:hypothetical protein [Paludibacteraceae bacterium]